MKTKYILFLFFFPVALNAQTSVKASGDRTFVYDSIAPQGEVGNKAFQENYTKGMASYNKGVDILNKMMPATDLVQIDKIQDEAKVQFKEALPFLERAYRLERSNKTVLKALQGVYFSQFDFEKADKMKKELESLKK